MGLARPRFHRGGQAALRCRRCSGAARATAKDLHAADLADLIEALEPDERVRLIAVLGRIFDVEALAELDEGGARPTDGGACRPRSSPPPSTSSTPTTPLYLIEDLDKEDQEEILAKVSQEDRVALNRALEYPEGTAGRLMQTEFVAVPAFWTVGQTIDHMRAEKELPEDFVEIYVVDPSFHLVGVVPVSRILRNQRDRKIADDHGRGADGLPRHR